MINMGELRTTFEALGFERVVSYINSGNLAFDSKKASERSLIKRLQEAVENDFGKAVKIMVRDQKDIDRILANNPYDGEFASHKEMHILFLNEELSQEKAALLREMAPEAERFTVAGREIYCHLTMGVADSVMGRGSFEKKLKVDVTARNWRTVEKLAEL